MASARDHEEAAVFAFGEGVVGHRNRSGAAGVVAKIEFFPWSVERARSVGAIDDVEHVGSVLGLVTHHVVAGADFLRDREGAGGTSGDGVNDGGARPGAVAFGGVFWPTHGEHVFDAVLGEDAHAPVGPVGVFETVFGVAGLDVVPAPDVGPQRDVNRHGQDSVYKGAAVNHPRRNNVVGWGVLPGSSTLVGPAKGEERLSEEANAEREEAGESHGECVAKWSDAISGRFG